MVVEGILKTLKDQLRKAEAEVKEYNTMISKLELMGANPITVTPLREQRKASENTIIQLRRMIDAATAVPEKAVEDRPVAFAQRVVATTRSELPEVMQRVKELRAIGKLKGRRQRLPLEDCYDLIQTHPMVRQVVAEQFWRQVDKSEAQGECWLVREPFKRNPTKKTLIKQVYIAALQCKLPAVRLACILEGLDVAEEGLRNSCGNEQCVKPSHNEGPTGHRRKRVPMRDRATTTMTSVNAGELDDYAQYIYELLNDQREDQQENQGVAFREAEQRLVNINQGVPSKDAMIKAIRAEKTKLNRFYLNPDKGRLYLTGFPNHLRGV